MITVVIPAFNAQATLARALASCLTQPEVSQVVVVDDASQDATFALAHSWAAQHPRIEVHQLPINQGAAAARNHGVLRANQEWLAFLDADDCYLPDALRLASLAFQQHAQLAAIKLPCRFVDGPAHLEANPLYADACAVLNNTFAGNLLIRKPIFMLMQGFPSHAIFRSEGGEDGALMLALSRYFTVGQLVQHPPCVQVSLREGSHSLRFFSYFFREYQTTPIDQGPSPQGEVWRQTQAYVQSVEHNLAYAAWPHTPEEKGFVPIWANA